MTGALYLMLACPDFLCFKTDSLPVFLFWKIFEISFTLVFTYDNFVRAVNAELVHGKKKVVISRPVNKLYLAGLNKTIEGLWMNANYPNDWNRNVKKIVKRIARSRSIVKTKRC